VPEDATEHAAVFGEHRKIAILIQRARRDRDLVTHEAATTHGAAEDPVRCEMMPRMGSRG
jgi:hypothetical protein